MADLVELFCDSPEVAWDFCEERGWFLPFYDLPRAHTYHRDGTTSSGAYYGYGTTAVGNHMHFPEWATTDGMPFPLFWRQMGEPADDFDHPRVRSTRFPRRRTTTIR